MKAFKLIVLTRLTPVPFGLQNAVFSVSKWVSPYPREDLICFKEKFWNLFVSICVSFHQLAMWPLPWRECHRPFPHPVHQRVHGLHAQKVTIIIIILIHSITSPSSSSPTWSTCTMYMYMYMSSTLRRWPPSPPLWSRSTSSSYTHWHRHHNNNQCIHGAGVYRTIFF